jgi:hypothetical protein
VQLTNCKLQLTSYKLQDTSYKLQAARYKSQVKIMIILTNFQLGKKKLRQKYFLNISEDEKDPLQVRDRSHE